MEVALNSIPVELPIHLYFQENSKNRSTFDDITWNHYNIDPDLSQQSLNGKIPMLLFNLNSKLSTIFSVLLLRRKAKTLPETKLCVQSPLQITTLSLLFWKFNPVNIRFHSSNYQHLNHFLNWRSCFAGTH